MSKNNRIVDFSNHVHVVKIETDLCRIDQFSIPNTKEGAISFVNTEDGLAVFGDYGNWIFCQKFIPTANGRVDPFYWAEKLRINSSQNDSSYDSRATEIALEEWISDLKKEEELDSDTEDWLENLLESVDDELEYTYQVYRMAPYDIDSGSVPLEKKGSVQFKIIIQAFEEICTRLGLESLKNNSI